MIPLRGSMRRIVWLTTDFPGPQFTDQGNDRLRTHPERHAGNGADKPARGRETHMEIADLKKIGHARTSAYFRQCGLGQRAA